MKKILILLITNVVFSQTQIGLDMNGVLAGDYFGQAVAINSMGNILAVGAPKNSEIGDESGQVRVFSYDGENWNQMGLLNGFISSDEVNFGSSVSISSNGQILAVGSPNYDSTGNDVGAVQVFKYENLNWVQLGNTILGSQDNAFLGASVSLSSDGNRIAVGIPGENIDGIQRGKVLIYELVSNVWSQLGNAINGDLNDVFFGNTIKLTSAGDAIAISDFNLDSDPTKIGKVKIFVFDGTDWVQKGNSIVGILSEDNMLRSLDIDDYANTVVVGIPGSDSNGSDAGKVKVYVFDVSDWVQKGQDINGTSVFDFFGFSVSLFNDSNGVVVGSPNFNEMGKVSVYEYVTNVWQQSGSDILGINVGDFFGISVSVSSNSYVAVGAFNSDVNGENSGQVKVFDINTFLNVGDLNQNSVIIYPNPVENNLFFNNGDKKLEDIIVYNSIGQQVLVKANLDSKSLYIGDFSKGVYFLRYTIGEKKYFQKFLKK